jgi:hypothetical protein
LVAPDAGAPPVVDVDGVQPAAAAIATTTDADSINATVFLRYQCT